MNTEGLLWAMHEVINRGYHSFDVYCASVISMLAAVVSLLSWSIVVGSVTIVWTA